MKKGVIISDIYLKPSEVYMSVNPSKVTTVLGSCVSATMFSRKLGMGGICHGLLPESNGIKDVRYVDYAITYMLSKFKEKGANIREIEIKVFGGANGLALKNQINGVGTRNVEIAMSVIRGLDLNLVSADVGGSVGRKIVFYTNTGEVFMRRFKHADHK